MMLKGYFVMRARVRRENANDHPEQILFDMDANGSNVSCIAEAFDENHDICKAI
jgi:hypothetical protein